MPIDQAYDSGAELEHEGIAGTGDLTWEGGGVSRMLCAVQNHVEEQHNYVITFTLRMNLCLVIEQNHVRQKHVYALKITMSSIYKPSQPKANF